VTGARTGWSRTDHTGPGNYNTAMASRTRPADGVGGPPPGDHCRVPSTRLTVVFEARGVKDVLIVIALLVLILFSAAVMSARLGY
jgi:hypothetical protein